MGRSSYGSSVVDGEIRYFSASSLTLADPDSAEGCLRKWYYEKVLGKRLPSTPAQQQGTRLHSEIESYLRTGINKLGILAVRGRHMIPDPGPDLFIEHDIMIAPHDELVARDATTEGRDDAAELIRTLGDAPLRILDVPVVGYIDLMHQRCTNKGVSDIEDIQDPPGTVEVIDWKTTSRPMYIKTSAEMSRTIQMTLYGKWVITTLPATTYVRLSHGYFVTKGPTLPQKITLRLLPAQINQQWKRIEKVAGSIIDVARETDVDKVPANIRACWAFGGCPHRSYCRANTQASLASFFGDAGADKMLRRMTNVTAPASNVAAVRSLVGFGAKKPPQDPATMQAEMQRVAREEIEDKYPGLPEIWDELTLLNLGNPHYKGELARVVGELSGAQVGVTEIIGVGELSSFGPFSSTDELAGIVQEAKKFITKEQPREVVPTCPAPPPPQQMELLPPDAPPSDPELASQAPLVEVPAKRPRGRPRKEKTSYQTSTAQVVGPAPVYEITTGNPVSTSTYVDAAPQATTLDKLYFYVDCVPSVPFTDFWPMVHELVDDLNRASDGAVDFRLVATDHKFAYGRWKAAVAAALATCDLSPGHYVLCGAGGEIGMAVVEAMRFVVAARHGVFVQ